jgi:hypothetical protein
VDHETVRILYVEMRKLEANDGFQGQRDRVIYLFSAAAPAQIVSHPSQCSQHLSPIEPLPGAMVAEIRQSRPPLR